jgi:hypothetical protein
MVAPVRKRRRNRMHAAGFPGSAAAAARRFRAGKRQGLPRQHPGNAPRRSRHGAPLPAPARGKSRAFGRRGLLARRLLSHARALGRGAGAERLALLPAVAEKALSSTERLCNGPVWKALIEEEFGDGIMSAIDFDMEIERLPNPKGDRVKITMSGKFLPYKYYGSEQGILEYGVKEA